MTDKCLYCDQAVLAHHRCKTHLVVYLRMRAIPEDPAEARRERRWEARVSQ